MVGEAMASLRAAADEAKRREIESLLSGAADAKEGASAFAEKRAPVWRGE